MASNTEILIKRSLSTDRPASLNSGELAYSYSSNTIFIGTSDGLSVLNVGGVFYTSQIDSATDSATSSTLVRRDASGNVSFNGVTANLFTGPLQGNADTATALQNARDFSIDGDDVVSANVSFDGTGNVVLQGNLKTTGVTAGTYGGQTEIPVFTVDDKGRVSYAANVSVATTLNFAGDSGTGTVDLLTDTFTIAGGAGITSTANDSTNTVTFDVDDTVLRTNTAMMVQTIDGDVQISGNLTISGNVTSIDVQTLNVSDPLLYLAGNNYTSDVVDIGFVGNYFDGSTQRHTGVYRHAGDQQFYIFDNYDQEPNDNLIDPADPSFRLATLHTNLTSNTANVNQTLTLGATSQLYANGGAYFGGTPYFYGGASFEDYLVMNSANRVQLKNSDNTATAEIYNSGGTNSNLLYVDSSAVQFTGNLTIDGTLKAGLTANTQTNIVYYDAATKELTYGDSAVLTPHQIANGSYSLGISGTDGMLTTNGSGLTLLNGAILKDTSGNAIALGESAGTLSQGAESVAIGDSAGYNTQGTYAVAVGYGAGNVSQGNYGVAVGNSAGGTSQGSYSVAIGNSAGSTSQGGEAVAIGSNAAPTSQGVYGVAIGSGNVGDSQGTGALAIGRAAGSSAGQYSVALGYEAGANDTTALGQYAIAIGYRAGYDHGFNNSIVLNASGSDLSADYSGLYIDPVRYTATQDSTYDGLMFYNALTKEVRYSYVLDGGNF